MFRTLLVVFATAAAAVIASGDDTFSVIVNFGDTTKPIDVGEHQVMHVLDFVQAAPTPSPTPTPPPQPTPTSTIIIIVISPTPTPTPTPSASPSPSAALRAADFGVPRGHLNVSIPSGGDADVYQAEFEQSVQTQRNLRIAGPATVTVKAPEGGTVFLTYRITHD